MTPQEVSNAKSKLDAELANKDANVGIAFGQTLFCEFVQAGYIVEKPFGVLGTVLGLTKLPAYGTHYAFPASIFDGLKVADDEFKVGDG